MQSGKKKVCESNWKQNKIFNSKMWESEQCGVYNVKGYAF
jgi:hypothetical protein